MKETMRIYRLNFLFVVSCVFVLLSPTSFAQETALAAVDATEIDAFVLSEMEADRVPGAALVVIEAGEIAYVKGYGTAVSNGTPVTAETSFILGSVSKPVTATAIMQLVESGKIALDDPVQKYLPWLETANPDVGAAITIRHLLHHTSGLPTSAYLPINEEPLAERVKRLNDVMPTAPVGTFQYSSPNYQVLGLIVEVVSGQSFGDYIQEHIYTPLEMAHSFVSQTNAQANGMADGHRIWFGFPVANELPFDEAGLPNGYLISSAQDMAQFMLAHMNKRPLLSPQSIQAMQTPSENSPNYGFGWQLGTWDKQPLVMHGGAGQNFRTMALMLPDAKQGVIVLINSATFVGDMARGDHTARRIAFGITNLLQGDRPVTTSEAIQQIYFVINGVLAVLLLMTLWQLWRLRHWPAKVTAWLVDGERVGRLFWRHVAPSVGGDFLGGAFILFGIPYLFGASLGAMWLGVPDITAVLILLAFFSLLSGLIKLIVSVRLIREAALQKNSDTLGFQGTS